MRARPFIAAIAALMFSVSLPAWAGTAEVNFIEPDKYTDAGGKGGPRDIPRREVVLNEIRAHLEALAQRNLPDTQTVQIDILDIDIAGRREVLGAQLDDVRIYDEISPPRIRLRYTLREGGNTLLDGEERLSNPTYLSGLARTPSSDPIHHERAMLTKWFMARIVKRG
jgi:hypothetical protein